MSSQHISNLTEYTVTEISGSIKKTVEGSFSHVRVRGEISGFRGPHSSGHAYFSIKDERSRMDAVVWKGVYNRLKFKPEDGMEMIATGKITTFPGSSKYQIVIEQLEPAGAGALMAMLEERKKKLSAEGLFDAHHKQRLPFMPQLIGVITSPTGAVIRDILHRISDRFPVRVIVWPVRVQGETSGREVAAAIDGFNTLDEDSDITRPDLIIVARGGGSLEDLWGFNDEIVIRAASRSDIPLISAVGHETDWTLLDLVADERAPTPTGAAEMAVPVKADLISRLSNLAARLQSANTRNVDQKRQNFKALSRALPSLDNLLALPRRYMDETESNLAKAVHLDLINKRRVFDLAANQLTPISLIANIRDRKANLQQGKQSLRIAYQRMNDHKTTQLARLSRALLPIPQQMYRQFSQHKNHIVQLVARADNAVANQIINQKQDMVSHDRMLQSLAYKNVLKRGFTIVRNMDGRPVTKAGAVSVNQNISIEFSDGKIQATTTAEKEALKSATSAQSTKPRQSKQPLKIENKTIDQGSLF